MEQGIFSTGKVIEPFVKRKMKRSKVEAPYKKCFKCKNILPIKDFSMKGLDIDGQHRNICRKCQKEYREGPSFERKLIDKLQPEIKARLTSEGISVLCKRYECKKRFIPTTGQLYHYIDALDNYTVGGNYLYCCDGCKILCPIFNYHINTIFPLSDLFVEPSDRQKVRNCAYTTRKALLDIQMDEYGYHYCDVCGIKHEEHHKPMEMHHTAEVARCGLDAISSRGDMLTCYTCHKKITAKIIST